MTQDSNSNSRGFGISFSDGKPAVDDGTLLVPDMADEKRGAYQRKKAVVLIPGEPAELYLDRVQNTEDDIAELDKIEKSKFSPRERKIITVLSILNAAVFMFIGIYLVVTGAGDEYADLKNQPVQEVVYNPADAFKGELETYIKNVPFPEKIQDRFKRLYSENQDSIGWLRIDGTSIDYPVLKAVDNKVYERANFYREYDRRGSIFMDFRNSVAKGRNSLSRVTILWGHHLTQDATIFADVEKYMDVEYYKNHPIIEMDTLYDNYKWKVFACFTANTRPQEDNGRFFYYWDPSVTEAEMPVFINECFSRSWFINPTIDIVPQDKLLCLSTCSYILDDEYTRCVLMARLVRPGEKEGVDVTSAYQNENKRMPQRYYDINGLVNPFKGIPLSSAESNGT